MDDMITKVRWHLLLWCTYTVSQKSVNLFGRTWICHEIRKV